MNKIANKFNIEEYESKKEILSLIKKHTEFGYHTFYEKNLNFITLEELQKQINTLTQRISDNIDLKHSGFIIPNDNKSSNEWITEKLIQGRLSNIPLIRITEDHGYNYPKVCIIGDDAIYSGLQIYYMIKKLYIKESIEEIVLAIPYITLAGKNMIYDIQSQIDIKITIPNCVNIVPVFDPITFEEISKRDRNTNASNFSLLIFEHGIADGALHFGSRELYDILDQHIKKPYK